MKPINTLYEQNQEMVLLLFQLTHTIATLLEVLITDPFKTNYGIKRLCQFTIFIELCIYNRAV
jgi:hypothetical protein